MRGREAERSVRRVKERETGKSIERLTNIWGEDEARGQTR
jgi:hypothetical protein